MRIQDRCIQRVSNVARRPSNPTRAPRAGLPSSQALVEFLRDNPGAVGAREIGRAFGLGAAEQPALRDMLRRIGRSGELVRGGNRKFVAGPALPEIMQIERFGSDAD